MSSMAEVIPLNWGSSHGGASIWVIHDESLPKLVFWDNHQTNPPPAASLPTTKTCAFRLVIEKPVWIQVNFGITNGITSSPKKIDWLLNVMCSAIIKNDGFFQYISSSIHIQPASNHQTKAWRGASSKFNIESLPLKAMIGTKGRR